MCSLADSWVNLDEFLLLGAVTNAMPSKIWFL